MKRSSRLKIGYISSANPYDKRSWSGTHYSMITSLAEHCGNVHYVGPGSNYSTVLAKAFSRLLKVMTANKKQYGYLHSNAVSLAYAATLAKTLEKTSFDILFAPVASTEIANLETTIPIAYLTDATFSLIVDEYPKLAKLPSWSKNEGKHIETRALERASSVIVSSRWASDSIVKDYGIDRRRVSVIPFGANTQNIIPTDELLTERFHRAHNEDPLKLLFLAVEWERKGGDIAFETLLELQRRGINTELYVCGCEPPKNVRNKNMHLVPFIDKNIVSEQERFKNLLLDCHFLLLPTRFDCTPIVFCEASAFGLPVVTTEIGGISSVINNGINGLTLPFQARAESYADAITSLYKDKDRYEVLMVTSRAEFDTRLNWDAWGKAVSKILNKTVEHTKKVA